MPLIGTTPNTNLDDIIILCFVGNWKCTACGHYNEYIYLYASNSESHELEDCTGQCSALNEFIWSDEGGFPGMALYSSLWVGW
ncbi:MAG: hypothetical protein RLP14_07225 [Owenweeksia sp.]